MTNELAFQAQSCCFCQWKKNTANFSSLLQDNSCFSFSLLFLIFFQVVKVRLISFFFLFVSFWCDTIFFAAVLVRQRWHSLKRVYVCGTLTRAFVPVLVPCVHTLALCARAFACMCMCVCVCACFGMCGRACIRVRVCGAVSGRSGFVVCKKIDICLKARSALKKVSPAFVF